MSTVRPPKPGTYRPTPLIPLIPSEQVVGAILPRPLTTFVGRDRQIAESGELLRRDDVRLLTLAGPGGVGKSRLALEVMQRAAAAFIDGITFVPLAPLHDPALVLPTVAAAVGVRDTCGASLVDRLASLLQGKEVLLVLDNLEHVLDATPLIAELLAACPSLTVLGTSRAVLHLSGEHVFRVPPLALPNPDQLPPFEQLTRYETVQLFLERARAAEAGFDLTEANVAIVATICQRLDGLPLAIELAAARISHLSPESLLVRLERRLSLLSGGPRDQPARLRTMSDAISWSYDLLTSNEQILLRRLAIFVGGFTLEMAEAVAPTPDKLGIDIFEGIASLVDHSLIMRGTGPEGTSRFFVLETVREFGLEQLNQTGEMEAVQHRHAAFFQDFIRELAPHLTGANESRWFDQLAIDLPNVRASLTWTLEHEAGETALRLVRDLGRFWYARGYPGEDERWLQLALERDGGGTVRADVLFHAATRASLRESTAAAALASESLAISRAHGYSFGSARALLALGIVSEWAGDFDQAVVLEKEALGLMRALDQPYWTGLVLVNLADANIWRGELAQAHAFAEESLELTRASKNEFGIALALGPVAVLASARGDHDIAAQVYEERLSHWMALGDRAGIGGTLAGLAGVALECGQPERAARLLGAAYALRDALSIARFHHHVQGERTTTRVRARLGEEAFMVASTAGRLMAVEAAIADAVTLVADVQPSSSQDAPLSARRPTGLTPRQRDVLRLLVEGYSDREIASALFIGIRTVETHVAHLYSKLGVNGRAAAAAVAVRQGLV